MGKVVVEIPNSLDDVSLEDYLSFMTFDSNDEELITLKAFECFLKLDKEYAYGLPLKEAEELFRSVKTAVEDSGKAQRLYEVNGKTFGRIPNLDSITLGEYVDLDKYAEFDKEGKPNFKTALNFMSVLYRPVKDRAGKIYSIESYESGLKHHEYIKQLPASAFVGSLVFFCDLRRELLNATKHSIHRAEILLQNANSSGKNTGGMQASITSLKATLADLMKLPPPQFTKPLHFCLTKSNKAG